MMRDKDKECICKNCENCNWFRYKQMEKVVDGKPTGVKEMVRVCLFEFYFDALHFLMGSYDGLQSGINEARNRSMETKAAIESFGDGVSQIIKAMGFKLIEKRSNDVYELSDIKAIGEGRHSP